jgi:hypothetical protein
MGIRRFLLYWLLLIIFQSLPGQAYGSGACCTVTKGGSGKINLSVVGSSAWSHEMIADNTYDLTQQAVILKLGYPFGPGLLLQGQVGMPIKTELSDWSNEMSGRGGIIYGAGLGYELPVIFKPLELFSSISYTRSYGNLSNLSNGTPEIDETFRISEVQLILLAEVEVIDRAALYGGMRAYSGKNQLKDNESKLVENGEREGNLSPLAGLRLNLMQRLSLVVDGGFGHTKVLGVGAVFSL